MSLLDEITEAELERLKALSTDTFYVDDAGGGFRRLWCSHEVREHVRKLTDDNERMRIDLRCILRFMEFCEPSSAFTQIGKFAVDGLGEDRDLVFSRKAGNA